MNKFLENLLIVAVPCLKNLIESKVVPAVKRRAYERFDNFTNDRIEDLIALAEKIKTTDNAVKKQAHLEGFKLGLTTLRTIGKKLVQACDELEKAVEE